MKSFLSALSMIGHALEGGLFGAVVGIGLTAPVPLNYIVPLCGGVLLAQKFGAIAFGGKPDRS